jgi:hypothetical protein
LRRTKRKGVENRKEKRRVEYSIVGFKVATTFIIIVEMCKKEGI